MVTTEQIEKANTALRSSAGMTLHSLAMAAGVNVESFDDLSALSRGLRELGARWVNGATILERGQFRAEVGT